MYTQLKLSCKYILLFSLTCILFPTQVIAFVPVASNMRSFGTVLKAATIHANNEKTVFKYAVKDVEGNAVILKQWIAGRGVGTNPNTRIRMYIDGNNKATIDYNLYEAHGVGPLQEASSFPFASAKFGHAAESGWFNTIKIPFSQNITVTLESPVSGNFWYMIRGMENYPLILGDLLLPSSARLNVHRLNITITNRQWVTIANASIDQTSKGGGALAHTNWLVSSPSQKYQEGCVRVVIDGDSNQPLWLSSGFEDYFLVAYFHASTTTKVRLPFSGFDRNATHDGENSVACYRIHQPDPILFTHSLELQWEAPVTDGKTAECPHNWPPQINFTSSLPTMNSNGPVVIQTLSWIYTW